jgi:hypothetical protein
MSREVVMKHLKNIVNDMLEVMPNAELLGVR